MSTCPAPFEIYLDTMTPYILEALKPHHHVLTDANSLRDSLDADPKPAPLGYFVVEYISHLCPCVELVTRMQSQSAKVHIHFPWITCQEVIASCEIYGVDGSEGEGRTQNAEP